MNDGGVNSDLSATVSRQFIAWDEKDPTASRLGTVSQAYLCLVLLGLPLSGTRQDDIRAGAGYNHMYLTELLKEITCSYTFSLRPRPYLNLSTIVYV